MNRNLIFMTFLLIIMLNACNQRNILPEQDSYAFIHTVFFWFHDSVTAEDRTLFESGLKELGKVPSIVKYEYGLAAGTEREVVDNSYDYAWIAYFKNAEDQDTYQEHPLHLKFIENYSNLWKQVKVYDTVKK